LANYTFTEQGNENFTFALPLDVTITLPPVSLAALGNLISIPGLTLDIEGNLDVSLTCTGGFNITGIKWSAVCCVRSR
jgi:hypothetical protein